MTGLPKKPKNTLLMENNVPKVEFDKTRFSKYIKEKRKGEKSSLGKKYLSTKELAKKLEINYEQFRKILNLNKPTKKRDCIIAICIALRLDADETNKALELYQYMPVLNIKDSRDNEIIKILENQFFNPLTIEQINQRLILNGFPALDIIDHRHSSKPASSRDDSPFKLLKKRVKTFVGDGMFEDQYDSLVSEYSTDRYRFAAEMWLRNSEEKETYHLIADTEKRYYLMSQGKKELDLEYSTLEETGMFKDYYLELVSEANHEMRRVLSVLDDTKNYQKRMSANICEDEFHVFVEAFNYRLPEVSEYYVFEYRGNKTIMSVFQKSEFMHLYLTPDAYSSVYGRSSNTLLARYNSFEEIEGSKNSRLEKYLLRHRANAFKELKDDADRLISDIRKKKQFVRHLDFIYETRDKVCEFFEVEEDFRCIKDEEDNDLIFAEEKSVDFVYDDCGIVNITLDDLYQAFELGFNDMNEICRVKKKHGSIEKILNIG